MNDHDIHPFALMALGVLAGLLFGVARLVRDQWTLRLVVMEVGVYVLLLITTRIFAAVGWITRDDALLLNGLLAWVAASAVIAVLVTQWATTKILRH